MVASLSRSTWTSEKNEPESKESEDIDHSSFEQEAAPKSAAPSTSPAHTCVNNRCEEAAHNGAAPRVNDPTVPSVKDTQGSAAQRVAAHRYEAAPNGAAPSRVNDPVANAQCRAMQRVAIDDQALARTCVPAAAERVKDLGDQAQETATQCVESKGAPRSA